MNKPSFDLFPTVQSRIWAGIFFFTGTMILMAWIMINEPQRMEEFTQRFEGRSVETGAKIFESNCSTCHGAEGYGLPGRGPALNNPILLEYSFFEDIDVELENIDRLLADPIANGLNEAEVAELQSRREVLMMQRRDIEETLLYWYEPEQGVVASELTLAQLEAFSLLNAASTPPTLAEGEEGIDVKAFLLENGIQEHNTVQASINPEYLVHLSDTYGEEGSPELVAELTEGLTALAPFGSEETGAITPESFADWHNQIVAAQTGAAEAQTRFEEERQAKADEFGVSVEELDHMLMMLTYTQDKSANAQATFDNLLVQLQTEFTATPERITEFRDQVRVANTALDEATTARLEALNTLSTLQQPTAEATEEEIAAAQEASVQAETNYNTAQQTYNDLLTAFATEFNSLPERLTEVFTQLETSEADSKLFNELLKESAAELATTVDALSETSTTLTSLESEASTAEANIRTVANDIIRNADITITPERLQMLHDELKVLYDATYLPEVDALRELNEQIVLEVNFAEVSPARLAARTSQIQADITLLTLNEDGTERTDVPAEVLAFKQAELEAQEDVANTVTTDSDKASRFERLVRSHNEVIRLREKVAADETRLAAITDTESTIYTIMDELIEVDTTILETNESTRQDTHDEMVGFAEIIPFPILPYQADPKNSEHFPNLFRRPQMNWSGSLYAFIETTLISGRPGSGANWPGSPGGMVAWSQVAGGPLRPDQIRNLVDYIMNWNREFTVADVRRIRQYALVPGAGAGGGSDSGIDLGTDPNAIVAAITEQAITGNSAAGEAHFGNLGCAGCHLPAGGGQGPALNGLILRAESHVGEEFDGVEIENAEEYLIQSIVNPNAYATEGFSTGIMPNNFRTRIDYQQMADILAYLSQYD